MLSSVSTKKQEFTRARLSVSELEEKPGLDLTGHKQAREVLRVQLQIT